MNGGEGEFRAKLERKFRSSFLSLAFLIFIRIPDVD